MSALVQRLLAPTHICKIFLPLESGNFFAKQEKPFNLRLKNIFGFQMSFDLRSVSPRGTQLPARVQS